jgi:chemotaxis signal transduction protein
MKDLIVFSVNGNRYALDIALIHRITQVPPITMIPDAHKYIDGMISYEGNVTKVMNFRKVVEIPTYEDELTGLFSRLKADHKVWIETLSQAVVEGSECTLEMDPHLCELGRWLDGFNAHDEDVIVRLKRLKQKHNRLHRLGEELLEQRRSDETAAIERLQGELNDVYNETIAEIDGFAAKAEQIADSLQKLLIYQDEEELFAIRVDSIDDISRVDESEVQHSDQEERNSAFLQIEGVLEIDKKLINIIKSVTLPTSEV